MLDEYTCAHDRAGNRASRANVLDAALSQLCDDGRSRRTQRIAAEAAEHYYYDGQQVIEIRKGRNR